LSADPVDIALDQYGFAGLRENNLKKETKSMYN